MSTLLPCVCVRDLTRSPSVADIPGYRNRGSADHLSHSCRCTPGRPPSAGLGPRWSSAGTAIQRKTSLKFTSMCIKAQLTLLVHFWGSAAFFFLSYVYVCTLCFGVATATCPWLCPGEVVNITSTAQGRSTGLDAAQTARQTTATCTLVTRVWPCLRVWMLTSGLECWKMRSGRVRSCWARLTRYSLSRDLAAHSLWPSHLCRNGTIHWKASFT